MRSRRLSLHTLEDRLAPAVGDLIDTLAPPSGAQYFGHALAITSNYIAVGASRDGGASTNAGAVHLYDPDNGAFLRTVNNPNPNPNDFFGEAVALSGNFMAVGAPTDDLDGTDTGTAYLFDASNGSLLHTLHNPSPNAAFEFFGAAVAVAGSTVYVGAYLDDIDGTSGGSVFKFDVTTGNYLGRLVSPTPGGGDYFGRALAVSGDLIAVGAPLDDASAPPAANSGSVHIYQASTGAFLRTIANPNDDPLDQFGTSVGLSGNHLVVGAHTDDIGANDAGIAYVYDVSDGSLIRTLSNPAPSDTGWFGRGVAVSGDTAIVGMPYNDTGATNSGRAFVYDVPTGNLIDTIDSPVVGENGFFGWAVAASGGLLVSAGYGWSHAHTFEGRGGTAPNAVDDTGLAVDEDSSGVTLNLLANDVADDPSQVTITSVTQASHGNVVIAADGKSVTYTPSADYHGPDSFTYTITDPSGSDTAAVSLTVNSVNDPPIAGDDEVTVPANSGPTSVPIWDNDLTGPDTGETLTVIAVTQGSHGQVVIEPGGTGLTYEPDPGYVGFDVFTYTISDGNGGEDTAEVVVEVEAPPNNPPIAADDEMVVTQDSGAQTVDVLANDTTAPDTGETLVITAVTQGAHGTLVITGGGSGLTYEPAPGYVGPDSFSYTISDGNGEFDSATVLVSVQERFNNSPDAVDDSVTLAEDGGAQTIDVLANDTTADSGETLAIVTATQGAHGTVAIAAGGQSLTYTPAPNFAGSDSFLYAVSDGNGGTDYATVNVWVANDVSDRLEVVTSPGVVSFTEGDAPVPVDAGVRLSTVSVVKKVFVRISAGYVKGRDYLVLPPVAGIKGSFSAGKGMLTVAGKGTNADFENALRGVLYKNASPDPVGGMRRISFTSADALGMGESSERLIDVIAVNTAPKVTLAGTSVTYIPGKPAKSVGGGLKIVDLDDTTLASATVTISAGFVAGQDVLTFKTKAGVTANYDAQTGVLTFTGVAKLSVYQAILRTVKYSNSSLTPNTSTRTISFSVSDGIMTSDPADRSVAIGSL